MQLSPVMERFVMHWGEMGSRWGVNRTVAQIHALLFLSERPLHAEEIAETLGVARSNVSTSLKELQSWELVHVVHMKGDRRDHFEAQHDVREVFRTVAEGRKRREIDPTLTVLRDCVTEAGKETPQVVRTRIKDTLDFMELMASLFTEVKALPNAGLSQWVKASMKAKNLLG